MNNRQLRNVGILYIATDDWLRQEAINSAERIKQTTEYSTALVCEDETTSDVFDYTITVTNPENSYGNKPKYMSETPFDHTLYLDTDTYLYDQRSIDEIFKLLESYDILAALDTARKPDLHYPSEDLPNFNAPEAMPEPNTGVLAYTSDACDELFTNWLSIHSSFCEIKSDIGDQAAFRDALHKTDIEFGVLPREYNFRLPEPAYIRSNIKILHGRPLDYDYTAEYIDKNMDYPGVRYYPIILQLNGQKNIVPIIDHSPIQTLLKGTIYSIKNFGLISTVIALILGGPQKGNYRREILKSRLLNRIESLFNLFDGIQ